MLEMLEYDLAGSEAYLDAQLDIELAHFELMRELEEWLEYNSY